MLSGENPERLKHTRRKASLKNRSSVFAFEVQQVCVGVSESNRDPDVTEKMQIVSHTWKCKATDGVTSADRFDY